MRSMGHTNIVTVWLFVAAMAAPAAGCAGGAGPGDAGGQADAATDEGAEIPDVPDPSDVGTDGPVSDGASDGQVEVEPTLDLGQPDETTTGGDPHWVSLAPLPDGPRQEVGVAALGSKIYVVGGFAGGLSIVADVVVYDPATDSWTSLAPLPAARHHTNLAAVGGKLVAAGSSEGIFFTARGDTWIYDPATDLWSVGASMPPGTERGASAVGVLGDQVIVAGGLRGGGAVSNVSSYDPALDAWTELPDLPEALDHLVGGVVDGIFYTAGGRHGDTGSHISRVDAWDPAVGAWQSRAPMPTSRGGAAAGVVGGLLVVVGGEGNDNAASGVFDEAEAYDPITDSWTTLPPMKTPRHGTGAAGLDGRLYVPGGADVELFGGVSTHEALVF